MCGISNTCVVLATTRRQLHSYLQNTVKCTRLVVIRQFRVSRRVACGCIDRVSSQRSVTHCSGAVFAAAYASVVKTEVVDEELSRISPVCSGRLQATTGTCWSLGWLVGST